MSSSLQRAASILLADVVPFSGAAGRPLRSYQALCARAILRSVLRGEGRVFTVMFARQMGKNETSAEIEAYLLALYARQGGMVVKAAPSFKPQVITSMLRLQGTLEGNPLTRGRWRPRFGYMIGLGAASAAFFSAEPHANVVGATASLLLEIDEAQDVDPEKYDRDFRPMASSTNATTVLYGTAWGRDSLLERQRQRNLELQERIGEQLHFEFDWRTLAGLSPAYGRYVQAEIDRLGIEHPSIQTQYLLHPLDHAGSLFSAAQRQALEGTHPRARVPRPGAVYIAGVDVAGEDEQGVDAEARRRSPRRDSTVITIAEVERDDIGGPVLHVVDHVWWTGRDQVWQYERLLDLWRHWGLACVAVDAGGIGAGLASFLAAQRPGRVQAVIFSGPVKSRLAFGLLATINTGRISLYADDGSAEARQCRREIAATRYQLRANEQLAWEVPASEGHDDFVVSLALCCRAAEDMPPAPASALLRALPPQEEEW